MGLDMYLQCRKYVSDYGKDVNGNFTSGFRKNNLFSVHGVEINAAKVCAIVEEAGYWRKANAIHNWFVSNVQNGEDNCGTNYVERDQLQELLDVVNKVLDNIELMDGEVYAGTQIKNGETTILKEPGKIIVDTTTAEELLPTTSGFFFGGTAYDIYYYEDLVATKQILEEALKDNDGDYYYHSSW